MSLSKENILKSIESVPAPAKYTLHLPESVDKLLEYINYHGSDNIPTNSTTDLLKTTLTECCGNADDYDIKYVETLFEDKMLYVGVINLAHRLNLVHLTSIMCAQMRIVFRGKTPEKISAIFRKGTIYENKTPAEITLLRVERDKMRLLSPVINNVRNKGVF
jgi:hypothetical protein